MLHRLNENTLYGVFIFLQCVSDRGCQYPNQPHGFTRSVFTSAAGPSCNMIIMFNPVVGIQLLTLISVLSV